jgi:hypothetical protein
LKAPHQYRCVTQLEAQSNALAKIDRGPRGLRTFTLVEGASKCLCAAEYSHLGTAACRCLHVLVNDHALCVVGCEIETRLKRAEVERAFKLALGFRLPERQLPPQNCESHQPPGRNPLNRYNRAEQRTSKPFWVSTSAKLTTLSIRELESCARLYRRAVAT